MSMLLRNDLQFEKKVTRFRLYINSKNDIVKTNIIEQIIESINKVKYG